ncbi:protein kinase 2B, chloroplastic-like [Gossypium australe]|uniref:Protein kinase 2B, chloroplastic-like n=1 Tax=Gossypium australe TaxID=47621 RepID=A0A5B6UDT8_9ROSI|nr:protein kinase 2B, chloroplastic-like [Gossypium australe]
MGLEEPKPTRMSIQLVNRSIKYLKGHSRTIIDVGNGELVLRVGDEKVTLQERDVVIVSSGQDDTSYFVDVNNHAAQCSLQEITHENVLDRIMFKVKEIKGQEERMVQLDELDEW